MRIEPKNETQNELEEGSASNGNKHGGSCGGPPLTQMPSVPRKHLVNLLEPACGRDDREKHDAAPDDNDDPFDADQYEQDEDYDEEFFVHAPRRLGNGACGSTNLAVSGAFEPGCNCARQSASATVASDTK